MRGRARLLFLTVLVVVSSLPVGSATGYGADAPCGGDGRGLVAGPDGHMWLFEREDEQIARVAPDGSIQEFTFDSAGVVNPFGAAGPDGNVWYLTGPQAIHRITPTGTITTFQLPYPGGNINAAHLGLTAGPDGNLWALRRLEGQRQLMRITPAGDVTEFPIAVAGEPHSLITSEGSMWFLAYDTTPTTSLYQASSDGTVTVQGNFSGFSRGLVAQGGGVFWTLADDGYAEQRAFERVTSTGETTRYEIGGSADAFYLEGAFAGGDGRPWAANETDRVLYAANGDGTVDAYPYPADLSITSMAAGPDGHTWFAGNDVGAIDPDGSIVLHRDIPHAEGAPQACEITPNVGRARGGDTVTLTGRGFSRAIAVWFGTRRTTNFTIGSDRSITVISPPGSSTEPRYVSVESTEGRGEGFLEFRYAGPPQVDDACPMSGSIAGGYWITVRGTDVDLATHVYFDGAVTTQVERIQSDFVFGEFERHVLRVRVPAHKGGVIRIHAKSPYGTGPQGARFIYYPADVVSPCVGLDAVLGQTDGIVPTA